VPRKSEDFLGIRGFIKIMKCKLCGKEIEETFLGKPKGTIVKIKEGDKNKICYVCGECQKRYGNKLRDELSKK